jgi:hypothetical protein
MIIFGLESSTHIHCTELSGARKKIHKQSKKETRLNCPSLHTRTASSGRVFFSPVYTQLLPARLSATRSIGEPATYKETGAQLCSVATNFFPRHGAVASYLRKRPASMGMRGEDRGRGCSWSWSRGIHRLRGCCLAGLDRRRGQRGGTGVRPGRGAAALVGAGRRADCSASRRAEGSGWAAPGAPCGGAEGRTMGGEWSGIGGGEWRGIEDGEWRGIGDGGTRSCLDGGGATPVSRRRSKAVGEGRRGDGIMSGWAGG